MKKMIRKPPHKNMEHPPGQIVNPVKTLGDYIQRTEQQIRREHQENMTDYERGYVDGWYDAHVKIKGI